MVKATALLSALPALVSAACISSGDDNTINNALRSGGAGAWEPGQRMQVETIDGNLDDVCEKRDG